MRLDRLRRRGFMVLPGGMTAGPIAARACISALLSVAAFPAAAPAQSAGDCTRLNEPIPATSIALPTNGAVIESATPMPAASSAAAQLPFGPLPPELAVNPAVPEYCKIVGAITPVDPAAPPIRFQVNLPVQWNGSSVQLGGAGFNGVLVTGLGYPPSARPDRPSPLARGFVTYGTDSGHQNAPGVALQAFALNEEALTNFAYASYKKVRDVAVELMRRRYGRGPAKLYYVGYSEGGREGLAMAQRFPVDYDGIFSRVPVINWVGLMASYMPIAEAQSAGGWLAPEKVKLVSEAVLAACDQLDGLADGIVSNVEACERAFHAGKLACVRGKETACLSDAEIKTVNALHSAYEFSFDLANGVRRYPAYAFGGESAPGTGPIGGMITWQTGAAPPSLPPGPNSSRAWLYGSGMMQYFIARDTKYDPTRFDPAQFADRIRAISALMDSTNPDLSAFAAHGGKLIISEHMGDYAQSPYAGFDYYNSVIGKMGQSAVDQFLRLYATPGADHMGLGAPTSIDMLEVLVDWVENGKAPGDLVQVELEPKPPFGIVRARPMCRYPAYPHYRGSGDTASAGSFECRTP
jgi:feruloyl esterase